MENLIDSGGFINTFANCSNLTGVAPQLWTIGTNTAENDYQGNQNGRNCFYNCKQLENYEQIPNYWKNTPLPS